MQAGVFWAVGVGIANIALNTFAHQAAKGSGTFEAAVTRPAFALAFAAGTASLALLMMLYTSGYDLARGILIAGATSIVLGVLWGVVRGSRLSLIEWMLWGAILVFYAARTYKAFTSPQ